MRYFIDAEYQWNPDEGTLYPLSIALVADDGREFYAVIDPLFRDDWSPFLVDRVLPVLAALGETTVMIPTEAKRQIAKLIGDDTPEFWGDYSAFDYVVLSMLMGEFEDWPEGWPMHINDMQQDAIPSVASEIPHNALSDARAVRDAWNHAFQSVEAAP